jgi:putative NADH-flavin reductase
VNITIIGASAGVGLEATRRALQLGHQVTSLSRRLDSLPDHTGLRKVQGSSTDLQKVKIALEGSDAILVAVGTGTSTKATTLYSDTAHILLRALNESTSTAPLIVVTGFGAGDSWDYNPLPMKVLFNLLLKAVYADKSEMERLLATGYRHWEIVRPGRLTNGAMTGKYRVLDNLTKGMRVGSVSRADVAHFLVAQAEHPTYRGRYPAITY